MTYDLTNSNGDKFSIKVERSFTEKAEFSNGAKGFHNSDSENVLFSDEGKNIAIPFDELKAFVERIEIERSKR